MHMQNRARLAVEQIRAGGRDAPEGGKGTERRTGRGGGRERERERESGRVGGRGSGEGVRVRDGG